MNTLPWFGVGWVGLWIGGAAAGAADVCWLLLEELPVFPVFVEFDEELVIFDDCESVVRPRVVIQLN